jgi:predicted alpha/beta-hydrolase family hydrolase
MRRKSFEISIPDRGTVPGLLLTPAEPTACYVMAHGAGAGMDHPFMEAVATRLAERNIATLRYQFPYMAKGSKRPDQPEVAHCAVRAAMDVAMKLLPGLPLLAGGKSFGGRMTSQAVAKQTVPGLTGLVFFGFPLHPAGRPGIQRAEHLDAINVPMLFLQGTRDALAGQSLLKSVVEKLGKRATLSLVEGADHSFHVLVRSGRQDEQVMGEMLDAMAKWAGELNK